VRTVIPDIRVVGARRPVGLAIALALAISLIAASAASAQSGGTPPPGGTTPPPTTPAPPTTPPTTTSGQVFPLPGPHKYGDGFGASRGKRSHQGQDLFAPCGEMIVSATPGKVIYRGTQSSAGNYVVIRWKWLKQDYAYMHLQAPAAVQKKQRVTAGQFIGAVGDTGNAHGCHLHFEIWSGKWYRGGTAIDPLSTLQLWDSYS
jgi:murein DD-endopeptidase MepM/ murein hydrolase activator NlpD